MSDLGRLVWVRKRASSFLERTSVKLCRVVVQVPRQIVRRHRRGRDAAGGFVSDRTLELTAFDPQGAPRAIPVEREAPGLYAARAPQGEYGKPSSSPGKLPRRRDPPTRARSPRPPHRPSRSPSPSAWWTPSRQSSERSAPTRRRWIRSVPSTRETSRMWATRSSISPTAPVSAKSPYGPGSSPWRSGSFPWTSLSAASAELDGDVTERRSGCACAGPS
jgi:hypothetical protein